MKKLTQITVVSSLLLSPLPAIAADSVSEALSTGKASLGLRYRFESVDQDGIDNTAEAHTLRTRLGYTSASFSDMSVGLEFDNISYLGPEHFNSARNGQTVYPIVADPEGTDLNQAFLTYSGIESLTVKLGRQRINLNNQRFVGGVGWRQNEQTYDAASLEWKSGKLSAFYAYMDNVNRIFGPEDGTPAADLNSDNHVANVSFAASDFLSVTAYAMTFDFVDADALSSTTVGGFISGSYKDAPLSPFYRLEMASQSEHANNPTEFSADYELGEIGGQIAGITFLAGQETLGADKDAGVAFQTPLATAHKFQGWADKFLSTPAAGVVDAYGTIKYGYKGVNFSVTYHDFEADEGDSSYGHEWDAVVSKKFAGRYLVMLKAADYDANTLASDTAKAWLMVNATF